jgi:hypothetical protein
MSWDSIGLLAIFATWVGLIFLIIKWPGNRSMTYSQHAAQTINSRIYYAAMWIIILPVFYYFVAIWLKDQLNLSDAYFVVASLATAGMLVAALVPEIGHKPRIIHRYAAFAMSTLMVPLLCFFMFSNEVVGFSKAIILFSILLMTFNVLLLMSKSGIHKNMFFIQTSHILAFHISIISVL